MEGIVLSGVGGLYTVLSDGREYPLRGQNKMRHERVRPVSGDMVEFEPGAGEDNGWLVRILPRKNELKRPNVANLDLLVVVMAAATPDPDLQLADIILLSATRSRVDCLVVVNKRDLDPDRANALEGEFSAAAQGALAVCSQDESDMARLRALLSGKIHAFCGQSGVGKSTLINALYGLERTTGGLSDKTQRGRHTTRSSQLIPLPGGGMVLDTPGFSLLETDVFDPIEIKDYYPEFVPYEGKCRFSPCAHRSEPGCAVRSAVEAGLINENRWKRYDRLFEEQRIKWRDRYD